jgi:hypothetical protein
LKKAGRPLSSIETFALEFAPRTHDGVLVQSINDPRNDEIAAELKEAAASEVPSVSVHALDVLAEIYAQKNPKSARQYLQELADKYDTLRKGYWEFRMQNLGDAASS